MSSSSGTLSRLARHPLLHFLVLGVGLGALYGWRGERSALRTEGPDPTLIRVTAADIDRMQAEWRARWSRPPTPEELNAVIQGRVRETALYREAVAMGLDRNDPVIQRVLVQKLETLARDLVELSLAPTEGDLAAYFAQHAERYRPPELVTFTQVFLDPDRRGDRTLDDAERMLAELRARERPAEDLEGYGDAFMLQRYYPEKTEQRIAGLFGFEFARSVFELEVGGWHGPVLSGYGTHLVYVHDRRVFPPPALEEVKERVTQDWVEDRRTEITSQFFDELLAKYDVVIESPEREERVR